MAVRVEEVWNTKNNEEAESGFTRTRAVDISDSMMNKTAGTEDDGKVVDTEAPGSDEKAGAGASSGMPFTPSQLLNLMRSAYRQGSEYQQTVLQPRWLSNYNAYNNKHNSDSKYSSTRFRGRTKLFRPKTRSAARKKQAEAAAALFSTTDALVVKATDESDKRQVAAAELQANLLKFRLDRANENSGIPWFMISMGAHLCAQQTGICVSKQYWEYRREQTGVDRTEIMMQVPLPPGMQMMAGATEVSVPTGQFNETPIYRVVRDRPRVQLFPPEDVIRDPTGAWEDQAQDSSYLILRHPMSVEAARTFLDQANEKSAVKFYDLTDDQLAASAGTGSGSGTAEGTAAMVRRAREHSGNDRYSDQTINNAYKTVWLHENFFRIGGIDYCFWSLGDRTLISDIIPTEDAYPEQGGARPVTIGVSALEPFKIDPMSPIESWQPLQQEINDVVNLRLDTMKQTIAPLAKVKRGRNVDVKAIQNRTPDSVVYMQAMDDVEFDRPGDVSSSAYAEMERLNADFDDQAGNFSSGSVQTNRSLNETVGGMQLMAGNANALGEFDLRVWIETWVENVLRQMIKLEQYYESDANVIAVSASRAKLMPRFGIDEVTDDLLTSQVYITLDIGIGSSDPMMSLQKFEKASQIVVGLFGESIQGEFKRDEIINEAYGKAGYQDAAERFFNKTVKDDPRLQQAEKVIQEMQAALQEAEKKLADKQGDQETRVEVAKIGARSRMAAQELSTNGQQRQQVRGAMIDGARAQGDRNFQQQQQQQEQESEAAKPDPQADIGMMVKAMMQGFRMLAESNAELAQAIMQGQQQQQAPPQY